MNRRAKDIKSLLKRILLRATVTLAVIGTTSIIIYSAVVSYPPDEQLKIVNDSFKCGQKSCEFTIHIERIASGSESGFIRVTAYVKHPFRLQGNNTSPGGQTTVVASRRIEFKIAENGNQQVTGVIQTPMQADYLRFTAVQTPNRTQLRK